MAKTRSALSIIKDMMTVEELSLYQETLNIVAKELERDFAKTDKTTITTARRITIPKKITRTILNAVAIAIQEAGWTLSITYRDNEIQIDYMPTLPQIHWMT